MLLNNQAVPLPFTGRRSEKHHSLYVGLKLHASARQKGTINTFHAMGMAVSYDRVMEVRKGLAISVSKQFAEDGVVLPRNIKRGMFTTE